MLVVSVGEFADAVEKYAVGEYGFEVRTALGSRPVSLLAEVVTELVFEFLVVCEEEVADAVEVTSSLATSITVIITVTSAVFGGMPISMSSAIQR